MFGSKGHKMFGSIANDIIDVKTGKLVAVCHRDLPQMDLDAERLVACYNACEGIKNPAAIKAFIGEVSRISVNLLTADALGQDSSLKLRKAIAALGVK